MTLTSGRVFESVIDAMTASPQMPHRLSLVQLGFAFVLRDGSSDRILLFATSARTAIGYWLLLDHNVAMTSPTMEGRSSAISEEPLT